MAEWKSVEKDGSPPCDGETVFVGININGFCGCFNDCSRNTNYCFYETAEEYLMIMDGLEYWKVLELPGQPK